MGKRYLYLLSLTAGILTMLVSFRLYQTGIFVRTQLPLPRLLGLAEVAALAIWALAAVAALIALRVADRPEARWRPVLPTLLYAGMVGNLALIGLAMFFKSPGLAPLSWKLAAVAIMLLLVGAFAWRGRAYQAVMTRALALTAAAVTLLPFLALPMVLHAAWTDQPKIAAVPPVKADAKLASQAPKRIVMVVFDGLRAASTTVHNPALDTTPHLARLAAESTTFLNARSGGDQTLLSMPTVLSGARPVDVFPYQLNPTSLIRENSFPSLAAHLQAVGYHTTYSTSLVSPQTFGFHQDFDEGYRNVLFLTNDFNTESFLPLKEAFYYFLPSKLRPPVTAEPAVTHRPGQHPAEQVVEQGLKYYHSDHDRLFVWVHINIPHHPFLAIPKADLNQPVDIRKYPTIFPDVAHEGPDRIAAHIKAYEDYLRYGDSQFARLLDGMRGSPLWDDTMVVFTADHGAELRQGAKGLHGVLEPYEGVTAVPLLIHEPGQRKPRRVSTPVRHEDVVPTILHAVLQHPPSGFKGSPLLAGPLPENRISYTWAMSPYWHFKPHVENALAAYQGRFKYVLRTPSRDEKLYDLKRDPLATTDVAAQNPEEVAALRAWVDRELVPRRH